MNFYIFTYMENSCILFSDKNQQCRRAEARVGALRNLNERSIQMIQDIAPHIYHNEYRPVPPEQESLVLYFEKNRCLIGASEDALSFPRFGALPGLPRALSPDLLYLFSIDSCTFYLSRKRPDFDPEEFWMMPTDIFRTATPDWLSFAGITAHQLYHWYDIHRFCGCCGRSLVHSDQERMLHCPDCGIMEYPKISPAVIVGILHKGRILMSKYAGRTTTHYALIAGFAEIGETIEETVHREVYEEVGLRVKNLHYYKSQPWSFSDSLLFGFFAELDGEDEAITLDTRELATAGWFTREEAPAQPTNISLTSEMIWKFKNGEVG